MGTSPTLNLYGDRRQATVSNFGVDIAAQRADELDEMAIQYIMDLAQDQDVRALDAASASGGQTIRMAQAGASALALDIQDYSGPLSNAAERAGMSSRCTFIQHDLTESRLLVDLFGSFDVIVCQRMIHYVPFNIAYQILEDFSKALTDHGRLYLSASGLHSELGNDYPGMNTPVARRHAPLATDMAKKHAIEGPVCLYTVAELASLLELAGMRIERVFTSAFGNVKAVACRA